MCFSHGPWMASRAILLKTRPPFGVLLFGKRFVLLYHVQSQLHRYATSQSAAITAGEVGIKTQNKLILLFISSASFIFSTKNGFVIFIY